MWSKEDCDGLHEACVEDINARSVSFTIIKGDLTMWSLPSEFEGAKEYFDMLNAPHYAIPGNHDKLFPWAFSGYYSSDLYYSFDYMGYHFICLDSAKPDWGTVITYTGILAFIDPDQMRWLEEDLGEHGDMPTMIFLHHPPIASIEQGIDSQLILAPQMEYIVRNYPSIVGIFAGHTHINRYNEIDGIPCVETASLIQYPCGYNVYKVYTHGYIQSFYKVHRLDISERSRDYCNSVPILTREPSEYMGALEDRDFVYTW
jgi:3',5'-cyclic AMP phosphodiesterase CpdA